MTPGLEQKLIQVIEQIQSGAVAAASAAKMALPELASVVLRTVQWDGAWHLLVGVGCLIGAAVSLWVFRLCNRALDSDEYNTGAQTGEVIFSIAALVLAIASAFQLFDMWNWVAILDPTAAIAHRAYQALMEKAGK
jgi:hypothetical protein